MTINITEHADRVSANAEKEADLIWGRRQWFDDTGRWDEPVIVVKGEAHATPLDFVDSILLIEKLQKKEKAIAVSYELKHNQLMQLLNDANDYPMDPAVAAQVRERDKNGYLSLVTQLGWKSGYEADLSIALFFQFLLDQKINTWFTDAASKKNGELDISDPSTILSLKKCFPAAVLPIPFQSRSSSGVFVRNQHMVSQTLDRAKKSHARVVILQCGMAHVLGNMGKNMPGRQSLAALFAKDHIPPVAIMSLRDNFTRQNIPPDHGLRLFFESDVPYIQATYDENNRPIIRGPKLRPSEFESREAEGAYLNAVLAQTETAARLLPEERERQMQRCRLTTMHELLQCRLRAVGWNL